MSQIIKVTSENYKTEIDRLVKQGELPEDLVGVLAGTIAWHLKQDSAIDASLEGIREVAQFEIPDILLDYMIGGRVHKTQHLRLLVCQLEGKFVGDEERHFVLRQAATINMSPRFYGFDDPLEHKNTLIPGSKFLSVAKVAELNPVAG